ncbi:MAG: shikimate kinase [Cupriavidus sp.]|nr:shikimate kinase [Cupriavidus sp.]
MPHARTLHLAGPGGAGKSTVGPILAQRLGWQFVDLDACFMSREGDIGAYIRAAGYIGYASRNVAVYREVARPTPTIVALSSGFLTYPDEVDAAYPLLRRSIETDTLTCLLLPAFELEACVATIVQRQLQRPYLPGDGASEARRIRERFPKFMAMPCARFRSDVLPDQLALQLERFALARVTGLAQAPLSARGKPSSQ